MKLLESLLLPVWFFVYGLQRNLHKVKRPRTGGRYFNGQKRCQICEIFIKWDGSHCPCCGFKLRVSPRGSYWKKMLGRI